MMDLSLKNNHNKQNEEYLEKIVFPPRTATDSFTINNKPRIMAVKRTKQICPISYLFQPVDPPQFSSHNNHGICVKVIEYVLETEKRRLTDLISENTLDANSSEGSIVKYIPNNYGTITNNSQASILSEPNIQHTPKTRPSVLIRTESKQKCEPSVSPSSPLNLTMFEESVQIFNFSKTSGLVESTSNNKQKDFPQISNSTSQQYISSFAKYTRLMDSRHCGSSFRENREETKIFDHPTYDTPTFSSFQFTNEAKNHYLTSQEALESKPPVRLTYYY